MRIVINYQSCWQASFLEGSDQEPLPKNNKREFNSSSKSTTRKEVSITKDTVMGVLCRLIGDQRKLYQARQSDDYYFKNFESAVTFDSGINQWNETVSIINKKEARPPQSNYLGVIRSDIGLFTSDSAHIFWAVLFLEIDQLIDFIDNKYFCNQRVVCNPTRILDRISVISTMDKIETRDAVIQTKQEQLNKDKEKLEESKQKFAALNGDKKINNLLKKMEQQSSLVDLLTEELESIRCNQDIQEKDNVLQKTIGILKSEFSQEEYLEKNLTIIPIRFYAAALYLQLYRMKKEGIDTSSLLTNRGTIQGFSKRGFNGVRDFLNSFSTSITRKTVRTPAEITKASGQLEINIDVEKEKALELKTLIENAGVSSFYLGKKGLAYVSRIRI
jgi:CRISPR-associated endoribonuclease Cas6